MDSLSEYRRKRDFGRTSEPAGDVGPGDGGPLEFVIQMHAASNLHFDLRLELDGVMKSWAVPRGPTFDPATKRLAMQTEDHPMAYNHFEGTIPKGEYGGGTVMLWDRGRYFPDEAAPDEDAQVALRRELEKGKLSVTFLGERMRGSFALVRTEAGDRPKWLLIKHRDRFVRRGIEPAAAYPTSVVTGRTLAEIAEEDATDGFEGAGIRPMLYRYVSELPRGRDWAREPALRGTRAHLYITEEGEHLVAGRSGIARTFAGIADGLGDAARERARSFVLDGEIVEGDDGAATYLAFDLLFVDGDVLVERPWLERREALDRLLDGVETESVRRVPVVRRGGKTLADRARREAWAGIVAKRIDSPYRAGERSGDWLKRIFRED
ncbi:MAG: DNA polymerase ligase N-terminal domain-containing protein [Gemmatimonadota bacterium]|jgi:bifunctional non-homologous end joining protein LigD